MTAIFLLTGYAGSGKTTAGDQLVDLLKPYGAKKAAFADQVKVESAKHYGFPMALAFTQEGKRSVVYTDHGPKTVRDCLIEYSLEMKKRHGEDVWARRVVDRIFAESVDVPWVLHDWRYLEEAQTIKRNLDPARIVTVRIVRPGIRPLDTPSEHELDGVMASHTILNNGTVETLRRQLGAMVRQYLPLASP
jgi:hypothetical protein